MHSYKTQKGTRKNEDVVIPIHPIVGEILNSGFEITTPISDQKLNKQIKQVCRCVGINDLVSVSRTEGNELVERNQQKWELISTHTARRSGATNMYLAGIPSISIMKITGHKTEKSFLKYIKISQEENAKLLSGHKFFQ
nr:tyrosine-type recombinase/integrase [Mangrovibacterium lignilyticum]